MILRSLMLRHGRVALPRTQAPLRSWRRSLATETDQNDTQPDTSTAYDDSSLFAEEHERPPPTTAEVEARNARVRADWAFYQHQKAVTGTIGSQLSAAYKPHQLISNPPRPQDITLELLMASQAHIGHATSLWNPANSRYIFGIRGTEDPIHIISLDATAAHLRRACKVVTGVTERGGLVLFVGSRTGHAQAVVRAAQLAGGCHLFTRWMPGTITNGQQILGRCDTKVVDQFDREVPGFEDQLLTKSVLKPDLVVCLNPLENYVMLRECAMHNIPTIGVIDTDANPTWVTYPIPANDDSLRCIQVIAGTLGRAGKQGQEARRDAAAKGDLGHAHAHGLQSPNSIRAQEFKDRQRDQQAVWSGADSYDESILEDDEDDVQLAMQFGAEDAGIDPSLVQDDAAAVQAEVEAKPTVPYDRDSPLPGGEGGEQSADTDSPSKQS